MLSSWSRVGEQIGIRCSIVRGGTSKGVFLMEDDLPPPGSERDALVKRIMGTPDPMQIDGLGGTHLITSKVAVIGKSKSPDADIDYTFAQIDIERDIIDWEDNCGNISAGVGPFSIDADLVAAADDVTNVRIRNINTGKNFIARVPMAEGHAAVHGDCEIDGVPGTGAEVLLDFVDTPGAKTGKVLPTGNTKDIMVLEDGSEIEVSLCDYANPALFFRAEDIGMRGDEGPKDLNNDHELVERIAEIHAKGAQMFGFTDDWRRADETSALLPLTFFVSPPTDYKSYSLHDAGDIVNGADMDFKSRLYFMRKCHERYPGTGSMVTAAASRIPGTLVNDIVIASGAEHRNRVPTAKHMRVGHPGGTMTVQAIAKSANNELGVEFESLAFPRTARKIMDGTVYVPAIAECS